MARRLSINLKCEYKRDIIAPPGVYCLHLLPLMDHVQFIVGNCICAMEIPTFSTAYDFWGAVWSMLFSVGKFLCFLFVSIKTRFGVTTDVWVGTSHVEVP